MDAAVRSCAEVAGIAELTRLPAAGGACCVPLPCPSSRAKPSPAEPTCSPASACCAGSTRANRLADQTSWLSTVRLPCPARNIYQLAVPYRGAARETAIWLILMTLVTRRRRVRWLVFKSSNRCEVRLPVPLMVDSNAIQGKYVTEEVMSRSIAKKRELRWSCASACERGRRVGVLTSPLCMSEARATATAHMSSEVESWTIVKDQKQ